MGDIDLSGKTWTGKTLNGGAEFNGNGYEIKNLKGSQGLFATNSGTVKNVTLTNVDISGGHNYVGGVVGQNGGTVIGCSVSGSIVATGNNIGGIAGASRGTVRECYTEVTISGVDRVGGVVGELFGKVENCYANSTVSGKSYVGGLVGGWWSGSTVDNSLSQKGPLVGANMHGGHGVATSSFYNKENTGTITYNVGVGLTTAEMQDVNTYLNAGWDISEYDGQNPPTTTWFIKDGELPQLAREWTYTPPLPEPPLSIDLQIGANSGENNMLNVELGFSLNGFVGDVTSIEAASDTLNTVDELKKTLNEKRSEIGVSRNRIDGIIESQSIKIENLSASHSAIVDTDFAKESASLVRSQILQQATSSLLKQANITQQLALQLLQ